jgi:hypothetical protein
VNREVAHPGKASSSKRWRNSLLASSGIILTLLSVLFVLSLLPSRTSSTSQSTLSPGSFYVAPTGSDTTGDGSASKPWRTLNKAEQDAPNGATVRVAAGIYVEDDPVSHGWHVAKAITWLASGTAIVKGSGPGAIPLEISGTGTKLISGFTIDASGNAASAVQLAGAGSTVTLHNNIVNATATTDVFAMDAPGSYALTGNTITATALSGTVFHMTDSHGRYGATIAQNTVTVTGPSSGSVVTGAVNTSGTLDFTNNHVSLSASTDESIVDFPLGDWSLLIDHNNLTDYDASSTHDPIILANQVAPAITNNTIDIYTTGAMAPSSYAAIDVYSQGMQGGAIKIENNVIENRSPNGYGIAVGTDVPTAFNGDLNGALVQGNTIYGYYHFFPTSTLLSVNHGIFVGYNVNATIRYNTIIGNGYGVTLKGTGTPYTSGGVYYNVFYDCLGGACVRIKGVENVPVTNNTFYNGATQTGLFDSIAWMTENQPGQDSTGCSFTNNIFYGADTGQELVIVDSASQAGFRSDYNDFFLPSPSGNVGALGSAKYPFAQWQAQGYDRHAIFADPLLIDPAHQRFGLQYDSPDINAGTATPYTTDIAGNHVPQGSAPDIGAVEFVLPASPASLAQETPQGSPLPGGGTAPSVTLVVSMSSQNAADQLTVQIEVEPFGTPFTGKPNSVGQPVAVSGTAVKGSVTITSLPDGGYHWQARVANAAGVSQWVTFGGSSSTAPDFIIGRG